MYSHGSEASYADRASNETGGTFHSIDLRNMRGVKEQKLMWRMEVVYSEEQGKEQGMDRRPSSTSQVSEFSRADIAKRGSVRSGFSEYSTVTATSHVDEEAFSDARSEVSDADGMGEDAETGARLPGLTPTKSSRGAQRVRPRSSARRTQRGEAEDSTLQRRSHRRRGPGGGGAAPGGEDMEDTSSRASGGRAKTCTKCHSGFVGFGSTCSNCRKIGRHGSVMHCQRCQSFFTGYDALCSDCHRQEVGSQEVVMSQ